MKKLFVSSNKIALAVSAIFLLAGCVHTQPPYALQTPFTESDFQAWSKSGSATLSGQAFLRTVGGDVKTCAGQDVFLMPATKYNIEIMTAFKKGQSNILGRSTEADKYLKKGICDSQGHFIFNDLAARPWIIAVDVTWSVPGEYGLERQGGVLMKKFDMHPGTTDAILTENDLNP